jgi:hypothetical protein
MLCISCTPLIRKNETDTNQIHFNMFRHALKCSLINFQPVLTNINLNFSKQIHEHSLKFQKLLITEFQIYTWKTNLEDIYRGLQWFTDLLISLWIVT